jgi:D-amino-acid oxidase
MHVWFQPALFPENEFAHVFPRPLGGGIIIGGVRLDNDHDEVLDASRTERIKQRACQLCPELGRPEELQVISQNVGLRRKLNPAIFCDETFMNPV